MSVNLELTLEGKAQSMFNLVNIDNKLKRNYLEELYNSGIEIRDTAKLILRSKVNPKWSTGKLEESIDVAFNPNVPSMRVGPDMRMAPYAEWVEFGHFTAVGDYQSQRGEWWEGHHYMEEAFLTQKDSIMNSVKVKLANEIRMYTMQPTKGGIRIRHGTELFKGTGRLISGVGGL